MITIAPENFDLTHIKILLDAGIILSLGHTNDNYEDSMEKLNMGITSVTHLFNAMSGMVARNPGMIGAALTHPDCYCGIIADLHHVHHANILIAANMKPDHLYLVTDAHAPNGTDIKEFSLTGKQLFVKNGMCVDKDGVLAGSFITLNQAVHNCITSC